MAQPFFETGEHCRLIAGFHIDDAIGIEPRLRNRGCEQIGLGHAPKDAATHPRENAGGEQRSGRTVGHALGTTCDFVQRTERQPATRQFGVHYLQSERQNLFAPTFCTLDLGNLGAQGSNTGTRPSFLH